MDYANETLTRADVDALTGDTVLEFGANWCGVCQAAQAAIVPAVTAHVAERPLHHLKIEDGRGRPLGRSFGIKLWPTLVFLHDGKEVGRLVRPGSSNAIAHALAQLVAAPTDV